MPLLNLRQNTPEWYAYRKGKIGASLAPVIMGVSPWQTPYQLWEEMLDLRPPKEQTEAMKRGIEMEQRARNLFAMKTGISVTDTVCQHDNIDWMFASLDGLSEDGKTIIEIKCPGNEDHFLAISGDIPIKYFPQLQHQMAVTGLDEMFYVSYQGEEIEVLKVLRDQKYIDQLIKEEKEFVKRLRTFDAPPMTARDVVLRSDLKWTRAADLYKTLLQYQKELEGRIEVAKNDLIDMCHGQNTKGAGLITTKIARKGNVDYSQIPELREIDLEKYRKPVSQYWKISVNVDE